MAGKGRPKGTNDIAPAIRGAFIRAAKMLEEKGKPLSEVILKELEERPLETLRVMASYIPKETKISGSIEHEHSVTGIPETIRFIEGLIARDSESALPEPGEDRSILPH